MTETQDTETGVAQEEQEYEVVIRPRSGAVEEHAQLLRKRLIHDGFHDDVVSVRPVEVEDS